MMTSDEWWKKAVVYQIYPQSFQDSDGDGIGDIGGIRQRLPYLKDLGIDVIWLNPIYKSPMVDNGYDIADYREVAPEYGTMADFDLMLKEAHELGIKIMMDMVLSVTSDEHKWFKESRQSRTNPSADYYIWRDPKPDGSAPNNWGSIFGGGSAWEYVPERKQYYLHIFATKQPDLNWENEELRQKLYAEMRFWLDKGVDGFRLDSISLISKRQDFPDTPDVPAGQFGSPYIGVSNGPRLHEFLQEMNREVLSQYDVMTVGEATRTSLEQAKLYSDPSRHEVNMVFQFDHMHVDYGQYGRYSNVHPKLSDVRSAMANWQYGLDGHGWNSLYWDNHDQPRLVSRFGNDAPAIRELSAKMLATALHFQQGTPFVYEGDEIGMTNVHFNSIEKYQDIEAHNMYRQFTEMGMPSDEALQLLNLKSRDNARTPMQWSNEAGAGFTNGQPWLELNPNYHDINVDESLSRPDSLWHYYQQLIHLRHTMPILTDGSFELVAPDDSEVFSYTRTSNGQTLLVVCSFASQNVRFQVPEALRAVSDAAVLIQNYPDSPPSVGDMLYLRPYEAIVFSSDNA